MGGIHPQRRLKGVRKRFDAWRARALCAGLSLGACGDPDALDPADIPTPEPEPEQTLDDAPPLIEPPPAMAASDGDEGAPPTVFDADPDMPGLLGPPYPIVLVHGFSGFADLGPLEYWYGVVEHLEGQSVLAFAPAQPPYQATELRAEVLASHVDQILDETGHEKVHLICHSQGGLDCRYLVSRLGYDDVVANIITVATPHRGTPIADLADVVPDGVVNPAGLLLGWLLGLLDGDPPDEEAWDNDEQGLDELWEADMLAAIGSMTSEGAVRFNEQTPDHPRVPVYSVAGVSGSDGGALCDAGGELFGAITDTDPVEPLLIASALAISGPDDGLVPLESQPWGTFLGCVAADHLDQIGQIAGQGLSDFDHLAFMDTLVDFLRARELDAAD